MSWNFNIIKDFDKGIDVCADMFGNARNPHVFSNPDMLRAWCDTYRPLRRLDPVFIVGENEQGNRVSFPLILWHRNWKNAFINALVPVGHSDFDYHDPVFSTPLSYEEKIVFWAELSDFLQRNIRFDVINIDGITDGMAVEGKNWSQGEICPMLHLEGMKNQEDLLMFFKTSLRGDIRRQMRRLSEIGELKLKEYTDFDDIPGGTFRAFMHQHSLRWPNAYKAPDFHKNLLKEGLKAGCVHFSVLMAGNMEVAWHLGFEYGGRYYYYMPAGNREYQKFSPVKVHLFLLVSRAIEKGYTVYDHLRGEENYKDGWSNDSQYVNTLHMLSASLSSSLKKKIISVKNKII